MSIIDSEQVLQPRIEVFKTTLTTKKKRLTDIEILLWDKLGKVEITRPEDEIQTQILCPIQDKQSKLDLVHDLLGR